MVGSEFAELKDMVLRQQAQLDLILKTLNTSDGASGNANRASRNRFRRAPDGQPICIKCNQASHIARYCTTVMQTRSLPASSSGGGVVVESVSLTEN